MQAAFATTTLGADKVVCDPMPILNDFDGVRYMGIWYEQSHSPGQHYGPADDQTICTVARYSDLNTETGLFTVEN